MLGDTPMTLEENAATLHGIVVALANLITKVDSNSGCLTELSDVITTVQVEVLVEVTTIKADQGRIHATVNNDWTKQLEVSGKIPQEPQPSTPTNNLPTEPSAVVSRVDVLLNAATHKMCLPKYDSLRIRYHGSTAASSFSDPYVPQRMRRYG
jgi:hypothetical protein